MSAESAPAGTVSATSGATGVAPFDDEFCAGPVSRRQTSRYARDGAVIVPPETAGTMEAAPALLIRASTGWLALFGRIVTGRSRRVQPGFTICSVPCPSVA